MINYYGIVAFGISDEDSDDDEDIYNDEFED